MLALAYTRGKSSGRKPFFTGCPASRPPKERRSQPRAPQQAASRDLVPAPSPFTAQRDGRGAL